MDFEKNQRRQNLKVIISEAFMVFAVIVTVIVLAFIVSGYWVNSDFEIERQGLLQISSMPTGANVEIDGTSSWSQKTNTSKVLQSGEHSITLTKEGYDSWSKKITIKEGLLYRVRYPRLFLKDRTIEKAYSFDGATFATISPDRSFLILGNDTTEWYLINLNDEKISPKKLHIETLFSNVSIASDASTGLFSGKIVDINWASNNTHVLFKVQSENGLEWVLLNSREIKDSLNLTREFGATFSDIAILDNDANSLLAVQNHNLHKIDVSNRSISAVLVENVISFDHYNNELLFSAADNSIGQEPSNYYIGTLKLGDKIKKLQTISFPAKVAITSFYEDEYYFILENDTFLLYKKDDFSLFLSSSLSFSPQNIKVGYDGEFVLLSSDQSIATLDMESTTTQEWSVEGETFGWLDNSILYTVSDGELIIYDFDGLNRRVLSHNVSNRFPVTITNNRYLYYFSDGSLIRESLIPR